MKGRNIGIFQTLCRSAVVFWIWNGFSALGTVYHSDGSAASVQGLQNQVLNGDTITIPGGTFTWSTEVTISKSITLQGAGIGTSIIKDAVNGTPLIQVELVANNLTRITGIEFQDGGRTPTAIAPGGIIHVDGSNTDGSEFRFDHNKWTGLNGYLVLDTVIGVVDHNTATIDTRPNGWWEIFGSRWNGSDNGDGSWAQPANFGSSQFTFFEDNTITEPAGHLGGVCDAYAGARFVIRHNTINGLITNNHGTESSGRPRGGRAMEIYNNFIDGYSQNRFVAANRSGSELFHDNTLVNFWGGLITHNLSSYRMIDSFAIFGGADGTNGWDKNNAGNPVYSGSVSANGNCTVTVSGNPWTINQWAGYTIKQGATFAYINSNTSNTLSIAGGFGRGCSSFNNGAFVINKVEQSLDQPGVGQSTLISGFNVTPPPNFTQVPEPCYIWNNTNDGSPFATFSPDTANIKQGVHYFNNTPMPGYTPYTYPHPLVSNASPTPTPTSTPSPSPSSTPTATATPIATATPRHTPSPRPSRPPR